MVLRLAKKPIYFQCVPERQIELENMGLDNHIR